MHFPLQLALSAVLANGIVAELTNSQQNKPVQKELDSKFQSQPGFEQQESAPTSYIQQEGPQTNHAFYPVNWDPVQKYATSFSAENNGVALEPSNEVPSVIDPYSAYSNQVSGAYSPQGSAYNPAAYNPSAFNPQVYNPGAFHVQTGYEGYLVPGNPPASQKKIATREPSSFFGPLSRSFQALASGIPGTVRQTGSLLARSFTLLLGLLGMTIVGGAITTTLCTFTPLCTISFVPFVRNVKNYAEPFVGSEKAEMLEQTMKALEKSVDTVNKMNAKEKALMAAKSESTVPETEIKEKSSDEKVEPVKTSDTPVVDN